MIILLLEPYFTGSHASWAKEYVNYSQHKVEILSMGGEFWKWRMHGGGVTLARKFLSLSYQPDLLLATDMLDLTTFLALTRKASISIKTAIYFHENQLTYPWSPKDRDVIKQRDMHYGYINYASALAADVVFFNSQYHPVFLNHSLTTTSSTMPNLSVKKAACCTWEWILKNLITVNQQSLETMTINFP